MPSDRSRRTDDLRDGYKEVVLQQGRVILDRDFNALQGLTGDQIAADALDVVGPCGTPDNGFEISLPQLSPPGPPLFSPPDGLGPPAREDFDFLISPGTIYVGGERAFLPGRQAGHAITYSYYDQPDWIDPPDPVGFESPPGARELVYLELEEQEVSAVEDPDLLEVALGGPDTTQRMKLMRRVKREAVTSADCAGAWAEATAVWLQRDGLRLDTRTMRLEPVARLQVGFTQDVSVHDPCDPVATGGYLGADNQLIRVQISHTGTPGPGGEAARLLWSYDNASFLYRITSVTNGTMLTLAADPPDAFHIPQSGQLVEMLRTKAVLGKAPDETDPMGQRSILRVVAAADGELRHLTKPYGSITPGDPTKYIVLDKPLDGVDGTDSTPLFLRVWQAELSFNPAGDTVQLNDPATGASTGVQVTISLPAGEVATRGAFWLLAMRPSTPQAVYPERLLTDPQPPDGPRRWVCPLAVIDWQAGSVTDCRCRFDNLVTLTKSPKSCCTVSVSPEELTATKTLQSIIDRAAGLAQVVTVCLSQGTYQLSQPLSLTSRHSNMIIEACGGAVIIEAANPDGQSFLDGLIILSEADNVTVRGLSFQLPSYHIAEAAIMVGLNIGGSKNLRAEQCNFVFAPLLLSNVFDIVGVGILLRGDCSGPTIHGCSFHSAVPPTSHLSSVSQPASAAVLASPPPVDGFGAIVPGLHKRWQEARAQARASRPREGVTLTHVATVGCLAVPVYRNDGSVLMDGVFGDICLRDNSFDNLGWAVLSIGYARTARLHDNSVTQCTAGIWLRLWDSMPPSGEQWHQLFFSIIAALSTYEYYLVVWLVTQAPWPVPAPSSPAADAASTLFSLFLTDNQIDAFSVDGGSSSALVILANRPLVEGKANISLIISDNKLRSSNNSNFIPTALIVVPDGQQRSVVATNLIFNEARVNGDSPSLYIVLNSTNLVQLFAVVGNSLLGKTNLLDLPRSSVPTDTWVPYNSILG
jgi:hypothetical protein